MSTNNFVPREMLAAEKQREREIVALETISAKLGAISTFLAMVVDGVCCGDGPYESLYNVPTRKVKHGPKKRKKAPSLAQHHPKRR